MNLLLIIAIIVIVVALVGFSGILSALRTAAWLILALGLIILGLAFLA